MPWRGLKAGSGTSRSRSGASGSRTRKVVPWPTVLVQVTVPLVLAHDAEHDGQAEAGADPIRLGGEERLEDPLDDVGRHAAAGIGDRHGHPRSRRARRPGRRGRPVPTSVRMRSTPPSGIASRALMHRFIST